MAQVTFLSWNIENLGETKLDYGIVELIAHMISIQQADIVAIMEVSPGCADVLLKRFIASLNNEAAYQDWAGIFIDGDENEGYLFLAPLSWFIKDPKTGKLTNYGQVTNDAAGQPIDFPNSTVFRGGRRPAFCNFNNAGEEFCIIEYHAPYQKDKQFCQAIGVWRLSSALQLFPATNTPVLIGGDFNLDYPPDPKDEWLNGNKKPLFMMGGKPVGPYTSLTAGLNDMAWAVDDQSLGTTLKTIINFPYTYVLQNNMDDEYQFDLTDDQWNAVTANLKKMVGTPYTGDTFWETAGGSVYQKDREAIEIWSGDVLDLNVQLKFRDITVTDSQEVENYLIHRYDNIFIKGTPITGFVFDLISEICTNKGLKNLVAFCAKKMLQPVPPDDKIPKRQQRNWNKIKKANAIIVNEVFPLKEICQSAVFYRRFVSDHFPVIGVFTP